jgi:hypothetical protein
LPKICGEWHVTAWKIELFYLGELGVEILNMIMIRVLSAHYGGKFKFESDLTEKVPLRVFLLQKIDI